VTQPKGVSPPTRDGVNDMFHSLDEQIESTVGSRPKMTEQIARAAGIVALAVVLFGGLCLLIVTLE
jgi:hypothetical protein